MQRENETGDDDVGHRQRQQKFPAETHQLVVTETRQRTTHPYIEQKKRKDFDDEPEDRKQRLHDGSAEGRDEIAEGAGGAAEEHQRGHAAYDHHVGVLGHEEHGELHGAVLGVISGDKLGFGFGQVEGRAVGLGVGGHEVDEEGYELVAAEEVPRE